MNMHHAIKAIQSKTDNSTLKALSTCGNRRMIALPMMTVTSKIPHTAPKMCAVLKTYFSFKIILRHKLFKEFLVIEANASIKRGSVLGSSIRLYLMP